MAIFRNISRLSSRKHFDLLFSLIFTFTIISFWQDRNVKIGRIPFRFPFRTKNKNHDNQKVICKPPNLNPLDDSIKHLVKDPKFDGCAYPLAFSSTFNSTLVTLLDLESEMGIKSCCYQVVRRGTSEHDPDDTYHLSNKCYRVGINKSETIIPNGTEFIVISCINGSDLSTKKAMDMHAFVHEKPEVEKRIKNYYEQIKSGIKEGLPEEDRVNVVIFGTDSVSQQEFQRSFSKTYKFLMEELSAYEMRGRNAISDGTFDNLIPFLTGRDFYELLYSRCYKNTSFWDKCPLTWKKYSANGYRTVYGEDSPEKLGTFNIHPEKGFKKPPTDYYFKPFVLAANDLIGNTPNIKLINKASLCYGPRLAFEVLLDYMKKVAVFMGHNKRYFEFIWQGYLTHDAINYGDEMLLNTMKWFKDGGYLNKTVLILLSDHGMRYGEIRKYTQGMIEERLPYLFFVVPSWFENKYPAALKNLKRNQDKLTTTYDLYETLLDLLHLEGLEEPDIGIREANFSLLNGSLPRGISHFLPIPSRRNCKLADIPEHYCTCHSLKATSETIVKEAANFVVNKINAMLKKHKKCARLSLKEIRNAYQIDYALDEEKLKDEVEGYKLSIETLPNKAIFEATVLKGKDGNLTVSGTISRADSYGKQSYCVDVKKLKLYCYCVK